MQCGGRIKGQIWDQIKVYLCRDSYFNIFEAILYLAVSFIIDELYYLYRVLSALSVYGILPKYSHFFQDPSASVRQLEQIQSY